MAQVYNTSEGKRCEKRQEHLLRAKWMNYRDPAVHLLTMVTNNRLPLLGTLLGEQIELTPLGQKVAEEIERIPSYKDASSIELYTYVIMPDHIHIMLQVHERLPKHLGQYVRWFKRQTSMLAGVTARVRPGDAENNTTNDGLTLGAIPPSNLPLFASEYHDRVLTGKGQLQHMKRYIQDNPRRLALKRANPNLFRIHQDLYLGRTPCVALGNIFLANYPIKEALQCSRRLTQEQIDTKRDECLAKAANGTVFISAAVSEGEKQICRALREADYPLIILLDKGFPEPDSPHYRYFKPQGVYFEACAAGKLLLVEPQKELLVREDIAAIVTAKAGRIPHDSQRYHFLALNAVAEDIANQEK